MRDFKKGGFGGGGFKGGSGHGASRGGPQKGGGFKGGFSRPMEMHQATCASCNKACEVPFRPNGKKPVFCKECFATMKGEAPTTFARPQFSSRPSFRPDNRPHGGAPQGAGVQQGADLRSQIEKINSKLDTLVRMVEELASPKKKEVIPAAKEKAPARKTAKKAAKK